MSSNAVLDIRISSSNPAGAADRCAFRRTSFRLDAGRLDDFAPARRLVAHQDTELLRAHPGWFHAEARETVAYLGCGEGFHHFAVQPFDDVGRRALWSQQ